MKYVTQKAETLVVKSVAYIFKRERIKLYLISLLSGEKSVLK